MFLKVDELNRLNNTATSVDDYGHQIPAGMIHFSGHFLKIKSVMNKSTKYKRSRKIGYFFKESISYPNVNFTGKEERTFPHYSGLH